MGFGRVNALRAVRAASPTTLEEIPGGRHAPVSNNTHDDDAEIVQRAITVGVRGTARSPRTEIEDDREAVPDPGRQGRSEMTAPDLDGLPDIATASYEDGPNPETVHGVDDRRQIQNTSAHPWRMTASLLITARDNSRWIGTGWFIGPRTLVTAGHVVFIHRPGTSRHGWVRRVQVIPGRNGGGVTERKCLTVP